jgi:predicted  nucleic acid-binding Zn-ribbon protein
MTETVQQLCDLQQTDRQRDKVRRQIDYVSENLENEATLEDLEKKLKKLERRRKRQAKQISPSELARYDRLRESYQTDAVAPIEVSGKKKPYSYYCGGCFVALPAEEANLLQQGDQTLRTCNHCGRMLYFQPEEEEATA